MSCRSGLVIAEYLNHAINWRRLTIYVRVVFSPLSIHFIKLSKRLGVKSCFGIVKPVLLPIIAACVIIKPPCVVYVLFFFYFLFYNIILCLSRVFINFLCKMWLSFSFLYVYKCLQMFTTFTSVNIDNKQKAKVTTLFGCLCFFCFYVKISFYSFRACK